MWSTSLKLARAVRIASSTSKATATRCPTSTAAASSRSRCLEAFPGTESYIEGLVLAKYGNARYHLVAILNLLELYPHQVVAYAVARAQEYKAYAVKYVRNICRTTMAMDLISPLVQVNVTRHQSLLEQQVAERPLSEYALVME